MCVSVSREEVQRAHTEGVAVTGRATLRSGAANLRSFRSHLCRGVDRKGGDELLDQMRAQAMSAGASFRRAQVLLVPRIVEYGACQDRL
jgi:hypothetical protein